MTLHILNQTHTRSTGWLTCKTLLDKGDMVLLSCDAVYDFKLIVETTTQVKVLQSDAKKRGVEIGPEYLVDFAGFVLLSEQHQSIQSWR